MMRIKYHFYIGTILFIITILNVSRCIAQNSKDTHDASILDVPKETPEIDNDNWWNESRFGLFINFDINNGARVTTSTAENRKKFIEQFNPNLFNADEWVRSAQEYGVKYIVVTARLNNGFCLYDSQYTDFNSNDIPIKRDFMQEVAQACRDRGMRFGWYYSLNDVTVPEIGVNHGDLFASVVQEQVDELLTKYGPVDLMWFDGQDKPTWNIKRSTQLYNHIKSINPNTAINICLNSQADKNAHLHGNDHQNQDFTIYRNYTPQRGEEAGNWASLMKMNKPQVHATKSTPWKSTTNLLHEMIKAASRGGNYMLEIPIHSDGLIPNEMDERLHQIGNWLEHNGISYYNCKPSPFHHFKDGLCTADGTDPSRLYFYLFDWPTSTGVIRAPGLMNRIEAAWFLNRNAVAKLRTLSDRGGVMIRVGKKPIAPWCAVIVVDVKGKLDIIDLPVFQTPHSNIVALEANDAYLEGTGLRLEDSENGSDLLISQISEKGARWEIELRKGGEFNLQLNYACSDDQAGSTFIIEIRNTHDGTIIATKSIEVVSTETANNFRLFDAGNIQLTDPGRYTIRLIAKDIKHDLLMTLRSIQLQPTF